MRRRDFLAAALVFAARSVLRSPAPAPSAVTTRFSGQTVVGRDLMEL
jgi:hypothetical protein